jgi:diaminopimelate decarboxylase
VKRKRSANDDELADGVLRALRRAAKKAVEFARQTGTPCYVLENGKIVDIARSSRRARRATRK